MKKKSYVKVLLVAMGIVCLAGCGKAKSEDVALEFDTKDYVQLGEYKNLNVQYPIPVVTDEDVESSAMDLIYEYTEYNEVARAAKEGDFVSIDFNGTIQGEEFEGGSEEEYEFTLGEGEFLEEFEANIIGKNAGETFSFPVVFPEDYDEELGGKEAQFEVTLNYVNEVVEPEYTDAFVAENTDYETIAAYEESLKEELMFSKEEEAKMSAGEEALLLAVENAKIEGYPQALYDACYEETVANYQSYAEMFGMEYEEFMSDFMEEGDLEEEVIANVNEILVSQAIAEKEGLEVTSKTYKEEATATALEYGYDTLEEFEEDYGMFAVKTTLLREKLIDFLFENAVIEEVSEEEFYGGEEEFEEDIE